MLSNDILIDIILYCPNTLLLSRIEDQKNTLLKLDNITNVARKACFAYKIASFDCKIKYALTLIINEGDIDLCKYILDGEENYHEYINFVSRRACVMGHKDILYEMINRGANNFNSIALIAAYYGHKDILYDMINRGVTNFNNIALIAAFDNFKCIVIDMINRGANNFDEIYEIAEKYNNHDIVNYLIENNLYVKI